MLRPVESIVQSLHPLFAYPKNEISYRGVEKATSSLADSLEYEIRELEEQLHQRRVKLEGVKTLRDFLWQCTQRNEEWELSQRYLSEMVIRKYFHVSNKTQERMWQETE